MPEWRVFCPAIGGVSSYFEHTSERMRTVAIIMRRIFEILYQPLHQSNQFFLGDPYHPIAGMIDLFFCNAFVISSKDC
jgi:hypothetical protein